MVNKAMVNGGCRKFFPAAKIARGVAFAYEKRVQKVR
jgi:hypothetical protein